MGEWFLRYYPRNPSTFSGGYDWIPRVIYCSGGSFLHSLRSTRQLYGELTTCLHQDSLRPKSETESAPLKHMGQKAAEHESITPALTGNQHQTENRKTLIIYIYNRCFLVLGRPIAGKVLSLRVMASHGLRPTGSDPRSPGRFPPRNSVAGGVGWGVTTPPRVPDFRGLD